MSDFVFAVSATVVVAAALAAVIGTEILAGAWPDTTRRQRRVASYGRALVYAGVVLAYTGGMILGNTL